MTEKEQQSTHGAAISAILKVLEPLDKSGRDRVLGAGHAYFRAAPPAISESAMRTLYEETDQGALLPGRPPDTVIEKDIRTLREEKQPKTDIEMAVLTAYYLKEMAPSQDRKDAVTAEDVETYFKQANYRLPKNEGQTLRNAKNAGYLDSAGEGQFKLNAVGHNLVVHSLPKATNQTKPRAKRKKPSPPKGTKAGSK